MYTREIENSIFCPVSTITYPTLTEAGVPYTVCIFGENSAGNGTKCNVTDFTNELCKFYCCTIEQHNSSFAVLVFKLIKCSFSDFTCCDIALMWHIQVYIPVNQPFVIQATYCGSSNNCHTDDIDASKLFNTIQP